MPRLPLLAVMTSIALLAIAAPASAMAPVVQLPPVVAFEEEAEEAEEEEAAEDGEEAFAACEEEAEECEEEEAAGARGRPGAGSSEAAPCRLRTASARASTKKDKLKLTIGYTTRQPVAATIAIRHGASHVGTFKRRLGRSGVLRFTRPLGGQAAGGRTVIEIELAPGGPGCSTRLTAKK